MGWKVAKAKKTGFDDRGPTCCPRGKLLVEFNKGHSLGTDLLRYFHGK